ncbi:MAG: glycosyltransferase family 4 protein [Ignavibacteriae bacterium]|nr:glycosyltransferase family 4 protein [Ignavibacteriota bacterium]
MKIVHLINYFQHQLGYQEYFLSREQAKAGHEVHVITSNKYFPLPDYDNTVKSILGEREFEPREETIEGFTVYRLKGILEQPARRIWLKGFFKLFKRLKPDLVIVHGVYNYYSLILPILQRYYGFKLIMDAHDHYTSNHVKSKSIVLRIINNLYALIINTSNAKLVAVTEQTKEFMINEYKHKNKIEVIPLGTDTEYFRPDAIIREETRKALKITENDVLIIYTGKIIETKDPVLILEALTEEFKKYNLYVLFIGSIGKDYLKRLELYKTIYKEKFIHIEAIPSKDLLKYYLASDIAIWPKEASMSSVDAMSCGLPIVVCDYLNERLTNNNGYGIREANLEDLRKSVLNLVTEKGKMKQMGKNGRALALSNFKWSYISQRFIDIADL